MKAIAAEGGWGIWTAVVSSGALPKIFDTIDLISNIPFLIFLLVGR